MVYILLAAFQRKLSLPSSACPHLRAPPHTTHTGQSRRRRRGRASRRPWSEAGPTFLGAPACSSSAAPGRGRPCTPGGRHSARGGAGASERSADKALPASRAGTAVSAAVGGRPADAARGRFLLASWTAYLGRDPCEKRGTREKTSRKEEAAERRRQRGGTLGASAGRRRAATCARPLSARRGPPRPRPDGAPRPPGDGRGGAREKRRPSRAGREGRPRGRRSRAGATVSQGQGSRCTRDGAGQAPRGEPPPSHLRPISRVGEPRSHFKRKESGKTGAGDSSFHKRLPSSRGSSGPQNPDCFKGFQPPGGTSLRDKAQELS